MDYLKVPDMSLRSRIRKYRELAEEIKESLWRNPYEWGKFQSVFNYEMDGIFRQIMEFERENLIAGREENVYRLKKIFVNRIRQEFLHGEYIVWSLKKPYGYAGDYKIIDDIYRNQPRTLGFDRLFDNYAQMSAISVAVRNRKDDFKKQLIELIKDKQKGSVRIMDLGCGPCREIAELLSAENISAKDLTIDCIDNDQRALDYSKGILSSAKRNATVNFIKENAVRLALKKEDSLAAAFKKYDMIYSAGLFDYFDDRIIFRLIKNLRRLLKPGGILAIADVRDKYSNPSVHFLEWVGDWNLIYREDEKFRGLFIEAGFHRNVLKIGYEQQGIIQYVTATE